MSGANTERPLGVTILLWVAKLTACAILAGAGYHKLIGTEAEIDLFTKIGMEPIGRLIIGSIELLCAVLILIPQSAIYGAFLGLGVMTGAIIAHLTKIGLGHSQYALLVALCCISILYIRRQDAEFLRNLFDR